MMLRPKELWHWLRPILSRLLGNERLERLLYAIGFYQLKSRFLVEKREYPGEIRLWLREPDVGVAREVILAGCYARAEVRAGDVVIDGGAHVGSYSVWASKKVEASGRVLSVEPEAENRRLLERNLAENGCDNVRVYPLALSDAAGTVSLHVQEHPGLHSIMEGAGAATEVRCATLDDVASAAGVGEVAVLKLDVEGAELKILSAAARTLAVTRQVIMELHKRWVSLEAMEKLLGQSGFDCEVLDDDREVALLYARRRGKDRSTDGPEGDRR